MTQTAEALTLHKVEDYEGDGECRECGRTGLRWIATLSDGSQVGVECAKRLIGWKPAPTSYAWTADYTPAAEYDEGGEHYVMWQRTGGTATRETCNGALVAVGGVRATWTQRGWL